jgi:hypothetical protein
MKDDDQAIRKILIAGLPSIRQLCGRYISILDAHQRRLGTKWSFPRYPGGEPNILDTGLRRYDEEGLLKRFAQFR